MARKGNTLVIILILVAVLTSITGYYFFGQNKNAPKSVPAATLKTTLDTAILSELQKLNIQAAGPATSLTISVPSDLSGPNWGMKKAVCQDGGYNLSTHAGKPLLFTSYPINEVGPGNSGPLNVWIISDQNQIVCVYKAVNQNSTLTPGIYSVKSLQPWKTFTNTVYGYSLSAPPDFGLTFCPTCNPPEVGFNLQNQAKTISVGGSYASQGSLSGNSGTNELIPTHNLAVTILGKTYVPEEYYNNILHTYIYKIDDVSKNGQFSQISLSGTYAKLEDARLVSQILSSFKFVDQTQLP